VKNSVLCLLPPTLWCIQGSPWGLDACCPWESLLAYNLWSSL
jgi:hypothetical protein